MPRLVLLLAIVVIAAHGPVMVGGKTWDDPHRIGEVVPAQLASVDAIAEGRLPGWWDRAGLGAPLFAEPAHAAAYPGWWPAAVAPSRATWALDVLAVLHALWAAIGAALLARRLGADELGAVIAGAILGAADVTTAAMIGGSIGAIAHLPWIAWAADGVARADGWRARAWSAAAMAVALAAILVAGRIAVAIDAAALALVVAFARGPRRAAAWCGGAVVAGVALAAFAIVPFAHHLAGEVGARAGDPAHGSPWNLLGVLAPGDAGAYVGGAAILLAVAAVAIGGPGRRAFAIAAAAFVALAAGALPPWDAIAGVDRAAYAPVEHVAAAAVLLAALAGVGFTELGAKRPDRRTLRAVVIAGGALVVGLCALGAARPLLVRALDDGDLDAAVARVDRLLAHGAVAVAVALGVVALLLASTRRMWAWAVPAAGVLAIGHAVIVGRLLHPTTARADVDEAPALLASAHDAVADVAATGLAPRLYVPVSADPPEVRLTAARPTRAGVAAARWPAPGRQVVEDELWRASGAAGGRMFDRYAIDVAFVPSSIATPADLPVLAERAGWAIVDTRARRARAVLAPGWAWFPDAAAATRAIFGAPGEAPLPLGTIARLGDGPAPAVQESTLPRPCDVRADAPERVVVHCDDGPGGMLVLADAWAPGWTVTVDGVDARLERVDVALRGVSVEAGAHDAVFTYTPPGSSVGRSVSALAVLGLIALLVAARPRRAAV